MPVLSTVELIQGPSPLRFIINSAQGMNRLVDAAEFGNGLCKLCWAVTHLQSSHD